MAPGKVKTAALNATGFGPSTRSKDEADGEVIKKHIKKDAARLQPSELAETVWANFTVADLPKVASGSARLNVQHNNSLKPLIVYACALLLICSQVRPTPEQAIAFAHLVEIPAKYGMEVYQSLLKKALTWIDNNVDAVKVWHSLVVQGGHIGWKAHVAKWTVHTTLEEMEITLPKGNNEIIWMALPAKPRDIETIVKEAVGIVARTGIWNVGTHTTESKKKLSRMFVPREAVGVAWRMNGVTASAKIEKASNGAFNAGDANNSLSSSKSNDTISAQGMNTHLPNTAKVRAKSPDPFANMVMSSAASSTDDEESNRPKEEGKRRAKRKGEISNDDKIQILRSEVQQWIAGLNKNVGHRFTLYDDALQHLTQLVEDLRDRTDIQFHHAKLLIEQNKVEVDDSANDPSV